jgi:hypothetical protein
MAVASLVLGILWMWGLGALLAVIFGYRARNEIDRSNGWITGRGMATAGIVLGWIGIAGVALLALLFIVAVSQTNGAIDEWERQREQSWTTTMTTAFHDEFTGVGVSPEAAGGVASGIRR